MVGERGSVFQKTGQAHYGMQLCSQARYMIILWGHGGATLWRGDSISTRLTRRRLVDQEP